LATDRLKIYNGALLKCKLRPIANLTVNEEARRDLDYVWNNGGVEYCLEQGQWLFARRTSKFTPDTAITNEFGYQHSFAKPTDFVNTAAISLDEYFNTPFNQFADEHDFWYADAEPIYVKYTSKDANYGLNFARWPQTFTEYVEAYFASKVVGKLTGDDGREQAITAPKKGMLDQALLIALNKNQQGEPARFLPQGSWTKARMGGKTSNWMDGGSRNRLIG